MGSVPVQVVGDVVRRRGRRSRAAAGRVSWQGRLAAWRSSQRKKDGWYGELGIGEIRGSRERRKSVREGASLRK